MSVYNRLSRPIGLICTRQRYVTACDVLGLNPHNNDVFKHVTTPEDALSGEFCRVIELDDLSTPIVSREVLRTLALDMVRNEARARKEDPRVPVDG